MGYLEHETLFRTEDIIGHRSDVKICVLGIGALGSNFARRLSLPVEGSRLISRFI